MDIDFGAIAQLLIALSGWVALALNHITSARKRDLDLLSLQIESLCETVKTLQIENGRLNERINELESEAQILRTEKDKMRARIEELEAETKQLRIENEALKIRIDELECENLDLKDRRKNGL